MGGVLKLLGIWFVCGGICKFRLLNCFRLIFCSFVLWGGVVLLGNGIWNLLNIFGFIVGIGIGIVIKFVKVNGFVME